MKIATLVTALIFSSIGATFTQAAHSQKDCIHSQKHCVHSQKNLRLDSLTTADQQIPGAVGDEVGNNASSLAGSNSAAGDGPNSASGRSSGSGGTN